MGSAALGLMVRRDLDITVVCPELQVMDVAQIGAPHSRGIRKCGRCCSGMTPGSGMSIPVTRMGCIWACTTGGAGNGAVTSRNGPLMVGSGNDCRAWSQPRLTLMS